MGEQRRYARAVSGAAPSVPTGRQIGDRAVVIRPEDR